MITPEQLEIRALALEFAEGEIRPGVAEWDAERELPDALFEQLAELGFWGTRVPEDGGGLGLDAVTWSLVLEALAWGDASVATVLGVHSGPVVHAIQRFGSPEQRERWLPPLASGETIGTLALAEDEAGSDTPAMAMRVEPDGDGWTLTGTKRWVAGADRAGLLLAFGRAPGEEGENGITAFLVPAQTEGVRVSRRERMMGLAATGTATVEFDEVRLPDDARLEGDGYAIALEALIPGHVAVAAVATGISQAAMEHALDYAGERRQFDTPIWEFGAIQEKLAGMATRIAGARALTLDAADLVDGHGSAAVGLPSSRRARAAMAKVTASASAMWIADEAVQIYGGYGYMRDYPVEKLLRDAKGTELYHGTNEVLRMVVARDTVRQRLDVD